MRINPVILIGGVGSRLWPLSRENFPKQFNTFCGEDSLFQQTLMRIRQISQVNQIYVVVGQKNYFLCLEQLSEIGAENVNVIVEPEGRNTAPAIAVAAAAMIKAGIPSDEALLVLPSDHKIDSTDKFIDDVVRATEFASDNIVLFGVKPSVPATGYGYIESKDVSLPSNISAFHEKPDLKKANQYLKSDRYWWNSGIFFASLKAMQQALKSCSPDILALAKTTLQASLKNNHSIYLNEACFKQFPKISFDCAVMEKTKAAMVVNLSSAWSDLGDWQAIYEDSTTDQNNNTLNGDVVAMNSKNSFLYTSDKLLAGVGLDNMIVVSTKDAVLVANKKESQSVKELVALLKTSKYASVTKEHNTVYKPWGSCETLIKMPGYHVRHVILKPGKKLSLQSHQNRSEHWVVLKGVADIVCGDEAYQLFENQSAYIPAGTKHRMANFQHEPLHFIEVQMGEYINEDDIIRYDLPETNSFIVKD